MIAAMLLTYLTASMHTHSGTESQERVGRCAEIVRSAQFNKLDYRTFDQDIVRGWRKVEEQCPRAAIDAIQEYIRAGEKVITPTQRANLHFHAVQLLLKVGDKRSAKQQLKKSFLSTDTSTGPLDWNTYVLATEAFVNRDRKRFEVALRKLGARSYPAELCEENVPCIGADPNFKAASRLNSCWDRPYVVAYYKCN